MQQNILMSAVEANADVHFVKALLNINQMILDENWLLRLLLGGKLNLLEKVLESSAIGKVSAETKEILSEMCEPGSEEAEIVQRLLPSPGFISK